MLLQFSGQTFEPLPSGGLFWRAENALLVADLHFEKFSSYAPRGQLLPPYDTGLTLQRLEADVLVHKPDVVTVMFGGNEAGFYRPETNGFADTPRVARAQFQAALSTLVDRLREAGITVVLMTCPPMTERYWGMHLEPYRKHGINFLVRDYAQTMRDVAAEKHVALVDVYRAFDQDHSRLEFFPDGLHPDARGHRVIADLLIEQLVRIVDPPSR